MRETLWSPISVAALNETVLKPTAAQGSQRIWKLGGKVELFGDT